MSDKNETGLGLLAKFLVWSTILGVVSSLFLAPAVLATNQTVGAGLSLFEALPSYLKPINGADASTIYANQNGQPVAIADFYEENRKSVGFDAMNKNVINAVIATEDPRFYQHGGVDWISFIRASLGNVISGGGGPGGSTITMQYVKNQLVEQATLSGDKEAAAAATTASGVQGLLRKIREIRLALQLEQNIDKKSIIAGYLNLSFFGGRTYGIEQAAEYYFGTKAADLNIEQSAMLAALLKSPNDYRPDLKDNLTRAKSRRDYVIDNMLKEGYISQQEATDAKATPIEVKLTHEPAGCEAQQVTAFFCDYVVWTIRNSPEFGPTVADRENLLRRGGLDIYTTLDLKLQKVADKTVKKFVPPTDKSRIGSVATSVEVGTGRIVSLAVNRIYDQTSDASKQKGHTSVNYATDKEYGGSSGFQVGSSYKVFTLAQWLISGRQLGDHVDGRVRNYKPTDFSARCGGLSDDWKPKNDQKGEPLSPSVTRATAISENTAFANMASKLDLCDIRDTAMRFGVHRADGGPLGYTQSSILGVNEIAPLTMAAAFAGIANHGQFCTPIAIDKLVVRQTGEEKTIPQSICTEAVSKDVAAAMIVAMKAVMTGGTGAGSNTNDGAEIAGKTGTTDSGIHTWMTGFTTALSTSVWVGNVVGTKSMRGVSIKGKVAATLRHSIWRTIMKTGNKLYKPGKFDKAPGNLTGTTKAMIPDVTGMNPTDAQAKIEEAGFNAKIETNQVHSLQAVGTVASTSPAVGSTQAVGSLVSISVSSGGMMVVPEVRGMTVSAARAALLAAGFATVTAPQPSEVQFFVSGSGVPAGKVVRTRPLAGSTIVAGGACLLYISTGP